jgi:hypothetical protein
LFVDIDKNKYPVVGSLISSFWKKAEDIQKGAGEEYAYSEKYLEIYWPPEELAHINLCVSGDLDLFFKEVRQLFREKLKINSFELVEEALDISCQSVRLPFKTRDKEMVLRNNIPEYVKALTKGETVPLKSGRFIMRLKRAGTELENWDEWCQKVVWYGNRRGAYVYDFEFETLMVNEEYLDSIC